MTLAPNKLYSAMLLTFFSIASTTALHAQPFSSTEARSLGMGDTGVASAHGDAAALFNPAMLSEQPIGTFQIILPNIGASAFADPDSLDALERIDDNGYVDNLTDASNRLNNGLDTMNSTEFIEGKNQLSQSAEGLSNELDNLSEKPYRINAGVYASITFPTGIADISIYANTNATLETSPYIDDCDHALLDGYIELLNSIQTESDLATAGPRSVNCPEGSAINTNLIENNRLRDPVDDLASTVLIAGVTVSEIGVALAHSFTAGNQEFSVGITPKLQNLTSYWARPDVDELDDDDYDLGDDLEGSEKKESAINIDVGFATSFLEGDTLTAGLVIKNLLENSYQTKANNNGMSFSYDIQRLVRAGIAWQAPMGITLAADLDLTKNDPYFLGDKTQFLALGAEWDILKTVQLRAGLRDNLENSEDQSISLGLGVKIFAVHLDLAAQGGDNNAGGALQLGLAF